MVMVTVVVHPAEVLLAGTVVVVWPDKAEARLCATTVTKPGISPVTVETPLRHVDITAQRIM